jgi:hypothetical protein
MEGQKETGIETLGLGLRGDPMSIIVKLVKGKEEFLFLSQLTDTHLPFVKKISIA